MSLPICPACSIFKLRHRDQLHDDHIRRPRVQQRANDKAGNARFYVLDYCAHSEPLFGPWRTAEEAAEAWRAVAVRLYREAFPEKQRDVTDFYQRERAFGLATDADFELTQARLLR